jgi:hypothetical protein
VASTPAIEPVPVPTTTPQSSASCQGVRISVVSPTPVAISRRAQMTTRRTPKRFMNAAANGPESPNSSRLIETATEMTARLQPNSCSSGTMSTPGVERMPDAASRVKNVTPNTIQA